VKYRVIYVALWLLTVVAFSVPWASIDGETCTGWRFLVLLPFSGLTYMYLIGMLIGLMVLITKSKPATTTIATGALMILGLVGLSRCMQ